MAISLSSTITNQINTKDIKLKFIFKIDSVVLTSYVLDWSISYDTQLGAASAIFTLDNDSSIFSSDGTYEIEVGDIVELIEYFKGDSTEFKKFYGQVKQRSIEKTGTTRTIVINCLDYISVLQNWDINMEVEGTRVKVTDEVLSPVYLSSPNDSMAQLFNFANDSIATNPMPLIRFKDKNHTTNVDSQYDGFEVYYDTGQLKLGCALNVRDNYEVLATYHYYTKGVYVEDVIEDLLTDPDGYGNYLFGQPSATHVIDLNLTTTFYAEEGTNTDIMTTNSTSESFTVETTLTQNYGSGATTLYLTSSTGFPTSGTGKVNGDSFTWTGKSGNNLTGVSGLKNHNSGDYCEYTATYQPGQIWETAYSNITTTLTSSDFNLSGGTFQYFSKRYGKLILSAPISVLSTVTCNTNYTFKTLQATGVEINRIVFRGREVANRMEAISKIKDYVAPNYIIRTQGDNKIWASYLQQKSTADYTLNLIKGLTYLEDEDLYTRVLMWAKNENPTNIMFGDDVDYTSDEEDTYTGIATQSELSYFGEEKSGILSTWADGQLAEAQLLHLSETEALIKYIREKYIDKEYPSQDSSGYYLFGTPVSNRGKIILDSTIPIVYVNGVPIDNRVHQMVAVPMKIKQTTKTITEGGGKSKSISITTYYYYTVIFPHSSLIPSEPIYLYDNQGVLQYTIAANDPNVDYGNGVWYIPGIERNDVAEILSTATYYVLYASDKLKIEYDDVLFKIHKSILPEPEEVTVSATFEYWAIAISTRDINSVVDGRRDTQLQLEFFGEPPTGFHLATIDLGTSYNIQALDIVAGFYKPDDTRKFDVGFRLTLQYSTDGTNFYSISDKTDAFSLSAGEAVSFEEDDLGLDFNARYLKFTLDDCDRVDYGKGRYVVSIIEISAYDDIVLESEATLIPTTTLTTAVSAGNTTIYVNSTAGFAEPDSGDTATAYLDKNADKSFTYTGLESGNTFTGVTLESAISADVGDYVTQSIEGDRTVYDNEGILPKLGDRVYKKVMISDRNLYSQAEIDVVSKGYLKEFQKNHSKVNADILYAPYLKVGQTVSLTDAYNNISAVKYFIDTVEDRNGYYRLVLARYPS